MALGDPADPAAPFARLRALVGGLGCARADVAALAVLACGGLAALGLLWVASRAGADSAGPPSLVTPTSPASQASASPAAQAGHPGLRGPAGPGPVLVVHVAGHVAAPGVYRLPSDARVADAVAAAGGALPDAALDHVNLARPLTDGEQILVPGPDDPPALAAGPEAGRRGAWRADGTLDLNRAGAADLEQLPGVGPVLAQRIVDHREQIGRFAAVEDLLGVSGIGQRTLESLRPLVSV